jgi:hypothetical protein
MIAAIEAGVPTLVEARSLVDRFHTMIRRRTLDLDGWIGEAATSLVASFASGIRKTETRSLRESSFPGQTDRQKARSPSSNW